MPGSIREQFNEAYNRAVKSFGRSFVDGFIGRIQTLGQESKPVPYIVQGESGVLYDAHQVTIETDEGPLEVGALAPLPQVFAQGMQGE